MDDTVSRHRHDTISCCCGCGGQHCCCICECSDEDIIEREAILQGAASRYLAGEITYDEMTAIRRTVDSPDRRRRPSPAAQPEANP